MPPPPITTSTPSAQRWHGRVPPARTVRAIQHRSDRDHRSRRSTRSIITRRSASSGWKGRVITTYRPDAVIDPEHELFRRRIADVSAS